MMMRTKALLSTSAWVALACSPHPKDENHTDATGSTAGSSASTTDGQSSSGGGSTGGSTAYTSSGAASSSETLDATDATTGDGGACNWPPGGDCDMWCQDCPEGKKCIVVGSGRNEPFDMWDHSICFDVDPNAVPAGSSCEFPGGFAKDTCEEGSLCLGESFFAQPTCAPLCTGTLGDPSCPAPLRCLVIGYFPVCPPLCSPLAPDPGCPEACKAVDSSCPGCFPLTKRGMFTCAHAVGGPEFSPCTPAAQASCNHNLFCAPPGRISHPSCPEGQSCCTRYCDLNAPECPAPMTCLAVFAEGAAQAGLEHVGVCLTPA